MPDTSAAASPFRLFDRKAWARLRADAKMTLNADDVAKLRSVNDRLSLSEVEDIYLPLARLIGMYVAASRQLFSVTNRFLGKEGGKVPFIIGIAGSVAAGKSTAARVLQELLIRGESKPQVALVTTDGFLHPNAVLQRQGLMERKGFPQSYDLAALLRFLTDIKAGKPSVQAPVYSHLAYDIVDGAFETIDRPDILIVEGLNLFQVSRAGEAGGIPFVSDFFDFAIFLDAEEAHLREWYLQRFLALRQTAFKDPASFFHKFAKMEAEDVTALALTLWDTINALNLRENIVPTRHRADLILKKGADHSIEQVALRRL